MCYETDTTALMEKTRLTVKNTQSMLNQVINAGVEYQTLVVGQDKQIDLFEVTPAYFKIKVGGHKGSMKMHIEFMPRKEGDITFFISNTSAGSQKEQDALWVFKNKRTFYLNPKVINEVIQKESKAQSQKAQIAASK